MKEWQPGAQDAVEALKTDPGMRERIPGSPLVPGCVAWAEDGRLAVVSDASIMIATFMSRELEMYLQQSPAVSKSFVYLPDRAAMRREHLPVDIPVFNEPTDSGLASGSTTYFLLNEGDRHQHNPKELSLSKNGGNAFLSATWGPRGSGPNSSCALLALTASSRVSLHFSSSFHMSWKEAAVLSESLFHFFSAVDFRLAPSHDKYKSCLPTSTAKAMPPASKKRRCRGPNEERVALSSIAEYQHKCAMLSTLSIAWSPFLLTADRSATTSLIAFSGRRVSTIWAYNSPEALATVTPEHQRFLSPSPIAWVDTDKHGWVSTSTWQQTHLQGAIQAVHETLGLALGTAEGHVLLANIPVKARAENDTPCQVAVDRVITAPHSQPVFGLRMGSRSTYSNSRTNDLVVASGSTISVWDLKKKRSSLKTKWKAHDGNVTGLDVDYFGDTLFSCAVDGAIRVWEKDTGKQLLASDVIDSADDSNGNAAVTATPPASTAGVGRYPVFGLAVSPSSAQLASVCIIPPAARPNRKSQADVSYSRVSSSLEYIPSPWVKTPEKFVDIACRILEENGSVSSFTDVVWLCYKDYASITSLHGSSDMTIPGLLNKLKGVCGEMSNSNELARQPLYLSLCEALEKRHQDSMATTSSEATSPLFLQASFLLRNTILPADHQKAAHEAALASTRRTLSVYWAMRCLRELLKLCKKSKQPLVSFLGESDSEKISALAMADFLSVQKPLSSAAEQLVTQIYDQLESTENAKKWAAFLEHKAPAKEGEEGEANTDASDTDIRTYTPPSREKCFICEGMVPFGELEMSCAAGHAHERCFLSFRVISSMDTWKCMGCGASACELDLSSGSSPFYLLDAEALEEASAATTVTPGLKIICRLCGNFCSFFKY